MPRRRRSKLRLRRLTPPEIGVVGLFGLAFVLLIVVLVVRPVTLSNDNPDIGRAAALDGRKN